MKTGRPKLPTSSKKAQITGVRLRTEERALLERAAVTMNLGLSEWMRQTLVQNAERQIRNA